MNYARLWVSYKYGNNHPFINLGDCIQGIAVRDLLSKFFTPEMHYLERDSLDTYQGVKVKLPMQAWFTYRGLGDRFGNEIKVLPPSNDIDPVYVGFHLSLEGYSRKKFKNDGIKIDDIIGCRDISTYKFMQSIGQPSYVSFCMTATFPKRVDHKHYVDYCIDCEEPELGEVILNNEMPITAPLTINQWRVYERIAVDRLNLLKNTARHVRTTRLHIYLPCIAMGIPVTYEGVKDERTDIINIINEKTIDEIKPLIISNFVDQMTDKTGKYVDKLMEFVKDYL